MSKRLIDLHFDKGNGALFSIGHQGQLVKCFLSQGNEFLAKKASLVGQNFPQIFERYASLIAEAASLSIATHGISGDVWGNEITVQDIEAAQKARRIRAIT
jgi:hypothetical protein